jgi:hypothetical protein
VGAWAITCSWNMHLGNMAYFKGLVPSVGFNHRRPLNPPILYHDLRTVMFLECTHCRSLGARLSAAQNVPIRGHAKIAEIQ